jgi:hypothetical protein
MQINCSRNSGWDSQNFTIRNIKTPRLLLSETLLACFDVQLLQYKTLVGGYKWLYIKTGLYLYRALITFIVPNMKNLLTRNAYPFADTKNKFEQPAFDVIRGKYFFIHFKLHNFSFQVEISFLPLNKSLLTMASKNFAILKLKF